MVLLYIIRINCQGLFFLVDVSFFCFYTKKVLDFVFLMCFSVDHGK